MRAAIDLARSFGLTTIAEGVETEEQLGELTALDCDLAQGYLWSRPVEAEKIAEAMVDISELTHDGLTPPRQCVGRDHVARVWHRRPMAVAGRSNIGTARP